MHSTHETFAALAAKLDAFALTLTAPEQILLAEFVRSDGRENGAASGARPVWPGLTNLIPQAQRLDDDQ